MKILAVFAHPDDEMGCVATLKKHAERGDDVMLVWTTHGELASQFENAPHEEVRRVRQEHGAWVANELGCEHHFFDMGDSRMTGSRDEALELARLYTRFKPDVVIAWSDDHGHPDHRMCAKIAFDALTLARIPKIVNEGIDPGKLIEPHRERIRFYQYPSPGSSYPTVHVDISEHIDSAEKIFRYYQEFYGWSYTPEQFRQIRMLRGREVGVGYAEVFQLRHAYAAARDYLI